MRWCSHLLELHRMGILTRRSQLGNLELRAVIGSLQPTILGHVQSLSSTLSRLRLEQSKR